MFGKPEWFRPEKIGWGLTPVTWQGWLYAGIWLVLITGPFLYFINHFLVPEAMIWLAAAIGTLCWDVRQILQAIGWADQRDADLLDNLDTDSSGLATLNYDLRVRN